MIRLKTLQTTTFSKEICLEALLDLLASHGGVPLIRQISQIGKNLHSSHNLKDAQAEMINLNTSHKMKKDLEMDLAENMPTVLYHRCAVKLLDELLRINPLRKQTILSSFSDINLYKWDGSLFLPSHIAADYTLIEKLFLLTNTIIYHLEGERPPIKMKDYSEKNKIFYSRLDLDGSVAIGRSYIYDHPGFSKKLKDIGIDIQAYMKAVFTLCAHMESNAVIEIELPASIKSFPLASQKILCEYLPKFAINIQSTGWSLEDVKKNLHKLYFNDAFCCQKPLMQIGSRYYCLQAKFLWAALADLPYYLLLNACNKDSSCVKNLGGLWGNSFEKNLKKLSKKVFGEQNCKDYECKANYKNLNIQKGHQVGDQLVFLGEKTLLIFEFKGALPTNEIKLGDRGHAFSKFIDLKNAEGIPQLVRDAEIYRQESAYNGTLYIIFVCRGPVPLSSDFDADLQSYLNKRKDYQKYLKNDLNKPLIYLDALSVELLFSAVNQGISAETIIASLAGLLPSKVLPVIKEKIQLHGRKLSFQPLYSEEVEEMSGRGRSMFEV